MVGLGAYTKVIGDAGVTVARRSSLPVTNGNSYSAATTLWAARVMVEKMGLVPIEKTGKRLKAKAMVIGATGGIGRVSALLLSMAFDEIVLAANRVDKLLELQDEILKLSPEVKVRVTTRASAEAHDIDLIVIATSNQTGSVIDIDLVKPGAVICDCSRPLDITPEQAKRRPDVLVIESGEVLLPGNAAISCDIGLPKPVVYACLAETVLLTLEGRYESFSLSKNLVLDRVKEIYKMGLKHGARLAAIAGPFGVIEDAQIEETRRLAVERLKTWSLAAATPGLVVQLRPQSAAARAGEA
jgi:predicted amino acid dehydrogenase